MCFLGGLRSGGSFGSGSRGGGGMGAAFFFDLNGFGFEVLLS